MSHEQMSFSENPKSQIVSEVNKAIDEIVSSSDKKDVGLYFIKISKHSLIISDKYNITNDELFEIFKTEMIRRGVITEQDFIEYEKEALEYHNENVKGKVDPEDSFLR